MLLNQIIFFFFFGSLKQEEVQSVGGNYQFVRERMNNRQSEFPKPSPGVGISCWKTVID